MKKHLALALALVFIAIALCGCTSVPSPVNAVKSFISSVLTQASGDSNGRKAPSPLTTRELKLPEILIPVSTAAPTPTPEAPIPSASPTNGDYQFPRL